MNFYFLKLYKCSYCAKNSVARFSTTTTYFMGMQIKIQSLKYGMMAEKKIRATWSKYQGQILKTAWEL